MKSTNENPNESISDAQNLRILRYLEEGHTITSLEALELFGCLRLASRISDLRSGRGLNVPSCGVDVKSRFVEVPKTGKRVNEYYIERDDS